MNDNGGVLNQWHIHYTCQGVGTWCSAQLSFRSMYILYLLDLCIVGLILVVCTANLILLVIQFQLDMDDQVQLAQNIRIRRPIFIIFKQRLLRLFKY